MRLLTHESSGCGGETLKFYGWVPTWAAILSFICDLQIMNTFNSRIMKYLFCCFLLAPFLLNAQCYGSFEVFGAAGLSNVPTTFADGPDITDAPAFANRFGFGASFRIGQRTYLRTSVQFSQYGSQNTTSELRWGTQHNGNGGFDPNISAPDGSPGSILIRDKHLYIEGALTLRYQFKTWSKWQPFVEGGLAAGKYGTTSIFVRTVDLDGESTEARVSRANSNLRSVALIGRLGAGTNYNFNERVGVYGMLVGQRHFTDLTVPNTTRAFPWQATLEVGVRVFVDPR